MPTEQIKGNPATDPKLLLEEFISLTPIRIKEKLSPQFTVALAHEIRNPLTNINLAIDLLRPDIKNKDQLALFDIIIKSSARINDIIIKMLENYEAKEVSLEIIQVHVLLNEVLDLVEDRISLKNIQVKKSYSRQDGKILVNKAQMMIALINIIINAFEAMPSSRGELKLSTRVLSGNCVIEIEDNGSGISKTDMEHIFKPYFTNKPGGMGLGLSTTLTTLLSNHARVKVYSEEGQGTRFVLFFEKVSAVSDIK